MGGGGLWVNKVVGARTLSGNGKVMIGGSCCDETLGVSGSYDPNISFCQGNNLIKAWTALVQR